MLHAPIKIVEVDLAGGPVTLTGLGPYAEVLALVRWCGRPVGQLSLPVDSDVIDALELWLAATAALGPEVARAMVEDWWDAQGPARPPSAPAPALASATVVVCTRDRPDDLRRCLEALLPIHRAGADVLIVDNAPSDDRTCRLVQNYPFRYAVEPRPGQNWARARGAQLATRPIVAYTDDDAVADPGWLDALLRPFADPAIAAASGLVMPSELETPAQALFEAHTRFGRGFVPRVFSLQNLHPAAAANAGTGANMAFRRELVVRHGLFAVELDGGTAARSGGDTYAFYRLLSLGHRVAYAPAALVWHRHRRTLGELRATLYGYSVGTLVCWLRCLVDHGETEVLTACAWWLRHHHLPHLWQSLRRRPGALPLSLAVAGWLGCLAAPAAYLATRRAERQLAAQVQI